MAEPAPAPAAPGSAASARPGTPAGSRRRARLASARLYLCTDDRTAEADLAPFLTAALAGGVDIVQLRQKGLEAADELALLAIFAARAHACGALVAVNDRADLAVAADADLLHLGQRDLTPAQARAVVGPDVLIGASTHTIREGDAAFADDDVDYYCVGPVWETPTKPGRPAAEAGALAAAAARAGGAGGGKPWFAIGGIDSMQAVSTVKARGATRIVVVRALTRAPDPAEAARRLRETLTAAG